LVGGEEVVVERGGGWGDRVGGGEVELFTVIGAGGGGFVVDLDAASDMAPTNGLEEQWEDLASTRNSVEL